LSAHDISVYSLSALCQAFQPMLADQASIITLTYIGSQRVMPNYNVMGVAKASLEASVRYLAFELGAREVRVNAISAGPIKTLAAAGIRGFKRSWQQVADCTPIAKPITAEQVATTAQFLLSDAASGITGSVIYVDNGFHLVGAMGSVGEDAS